MADTPVVGIFLIKTVLCLFIGLTTGQCKPFIVEGFQVGLIRPDVMTQLLKYPEVYDIVYRKQVKYVH